MTDSTMNFLMQVFIIIVLCVFAGAFGNRFTQLEDRLNSFEAPSQKAEVLAIREYRLETGLVQLTLMRAEHAARVND